MSLGFENFTIAEVPLLLERCLQVVNNSVMKATLLGPRAQINRIRSDMFVFCFWFSFHLYMFQWCGCFCDFHWNPSLFKQSRICIRINCEL